MPSKKVELLLLHALPLDGSMWSSQLDILPGGTYAPTLYKFGNDVEAWATKALKLAKSDRIIVVGCSVGGSCALEVAALAPERVAGLILIGTKAARRMGSDTHTAYVERLKEIGLEAAWHEWWKPAFSTATSPTIIAEAKRILMLQSLEDIVRGVQAFHTRQSRDDVLSTFPCPVQVVTGADDVLPGPATSAQQAELVLNGRLHVIPKCGHYVPMEQPHALNLIIRQLMDQILT